MLMRSLAMEEKQLDFNRPLLSVRRPTQASESKTKTTSSDSVTNNIPPPPVYKSDIKSGPVRNPGTVPFQWEHKPGKPKDERKPVLQSSHFVPKLPPGRIKNGREREESITRANHQTKTGSSSSSSSSNVEDAKRLSSRYDDDTYLDATDTLSRSESFFFNCSNIRGVSGLDGHGTLLKPFGTLSSDRHTQDLMMGRFLPAAKALTSETPPLHLARKPPKPDEQMTKKAVVVKEKQNKSEQNPYRFRYPAQQEEDGNTSNMMASGVCGLVPQICLRSSFGVLNPVPSVRMQAQRAVSVRRMRSNYQDSNTPCNENQKKKNNESVNEDKRKLKLSGSVSSVLERKEKVENSCSISATSRNKVSKNFGELLASDDNTWKPSSEAPVAEKTLYVDTVHSVDKKIQEESKEQSLLNEYASLDVVVPVKEEVQNMNGSSEEAISQPKTTEQINVKRDEEECPDQAIVPLPESNVVVGTTKEKIDLEVKLQQRNTTNLESSRLHHRSTYQIVPPPPLPKGPSDSWLKRTLPTIPSKNNSFTWLQSLGSDNNNNQFNKINQANPKWETMVKTSNTEQGFVCFSKETLNPIPEA